VATTFQVEVLTPEGELFSDEVEMVSMRTATGSIGIKANHAPLLAMLNPTELRLFTGDSEPQRYAQGEGYLQMIGNRCLILVEEAIAPDDLDGSDLESKAKEARESAEQAEEDSEERHRYEREARRYEAFQEVASGSS
jgi:F-type H+-transporting ATPase subunit epsilon